MLLFQEGGHFLLILIDFFFHHFDNRQSSFWEAGKNTNCREVGLKRGWLDAQTGVCLSSDAFFPFRDNIDRAARSGVKYILQAGGAMRDEDLVEAANSHGMVMVLSGVRLFHH